MDKTSNKTKHGLRAWLCFFFGLNIIFTMIAAALAGLVSLSGDQYEYADECFDLVIREDLHDTILFKTLVSDHMSRLLTLSKVTGRSYGRGASPYFELESELTNIACYVRNKDGTMVYDTLPEENSPKNDTSRYDYLLLVQNNTMRLYRSDEKDLVSEYRSGDISGSEVQLSDGLARLKRDFESFKEGYKDSGDILIVYAARTRPENHPDSILYIMSLIRFWLRFGIAAVLAIIVAVIVLFVYSSVKREAKRLFLKRYAAVAVKVWFEIKLFLLCLVFVSLYWLFREYSHSFYYISPYEPLMIFAYLVLCFWFFYFIIKDLQYNRTELFKNNSIRTVSRVIRAFTKRFPFERRMIAGFWLVFSAEIILMILFAISIPSGYGMALFALMGIVLFLAAVKIYHRFIADTGKLVAQIGRIKSGDLTSRPELDHMSDMLEYAQDLDSIQSGMSRALEERLASERLKVDLITNVSHDLKTPLTSIISYIDLIKKEGISPQAMEYADILSQKADRLKTMIQDIFVVSKATSGNLTVEKERLDLSRLVEQTLADMQERIGTSGLEFRVRHADGPLIISSDGQKLYRVFQNLIENALCYSLKGSRVYIRLWTENNSAMVEIKNTSGHELDLSPAQMTERFVRGDTSRSGDGSGLGLSIAQTFTEACGGSFKITIDYDDFRVRLAFPLEAPVNDAHTTADDAGVMPGSHPQDQYQDLSQKSEPTPDMAPREGDAEAPDTGANGSRLETGEDSACGSNAAAIGEETSDGAGNDIGADIGEETFDNAAGDIGTAVDENASNVTVIDIDTVDGEDTSDEACDEMTEAQKIDQPDVN